MTDQDNSPMVLLHEGSVAFNDSEYWLAHEAWEKVWKSLKGPSREYLQGLIQACGCLFHLQKNRLKPALVLGRLALEKIKNQESLVRINGLEEFLENILNEKIGAESEPKQNQIWLERAKVLVAQVRKP